jgi:hypothetical protein
MSRDKKQKPIKRSMLYEESYKKGAQWPHGKQVLIDIINQPQTEVEFLKAGTMNDETEYIIIKIDKINPKPFKEAPSVKQIAEENKPSVLDCFPSRFR